ncbi:VanZ family protein [Bombilactobacillus thymidiniphilus]|uniref:VanZ family protein n=1 Tax=Bombilactobacillus thymidiniphilus TaxID=2923363 RepID=A0ABY4PCT6_9LACO|nr:VanZ family protein [Bombilactobacillus thymidiniphilus]UQS83425.1 VanZ family protein [Bombilactobacillus thymidiniphilus]
MFFLNPIYQLIYTYYAGRLNHFPLIHLVFISLDKTIFYFLIFVILRIAFLVWRSQKIVWWHEFYLVLLVIYLLLLLCLTVFRQHYFPWEFHPLWHRSFKEINWLPLVETWKLTNGKSLIDFFYNSCGNVVWFLPLGLLLPVLSSRLHSFVRVVGIGLCLSVLIESLQFILNTGVSDIDDVIFNTLGTILGYAIWSIVQRISRKV